MNTRGQKMNAIQVIDEREVLGFQVKTYGDMENPLFLAKDVAEWIEHSDVSMMLRKVDEDEKLIQTLFVSGQNREMWFLSEDGLYEVLMQSRKPIAKQFKKKVKTLLKDLRLNRFANQDPYKHLSTEMKALLMHDKKIQAVQEEVTSVKDDLNEFKDDIPLFAVECEEITKLVKKVGTHALGGKGSNAYKNKSLRAKVYSDIYRQLKREFDVNSFKAIKRRYLDDALNVVDKYKLTISLSDQINFLNSRLPI